MAGIHWHGNLQSDLNWPVNDFGLNVNLFQFVCHQTLFAWYMNCVTQQPRVSRSKIRLSQAGRSFHPGVRVYAERSEGFMFVVLSLCAFCRVVVPTQPFTNTALYYKMLLESEPTPLLQNVLGVFDGGSRANVGHYKMVTQTGCSEKS